MVTDRICGDKERWASRIKPRLRIEGEGPKDKEDGGGKANEGSKEDLEDLVK